MNSQFLNKIDGCFKSLVDQFGFKRQKQVITSEACMIEYASEFFVIKLERYWNEFYVILYKLGDPDNGINLFNLLDYLIRPPMVAPVSNYFPEEKNVEDSFVMQLTHIATVIENNFKLIQSFLTSDDYREKLLDVRKFVLEKYPELFKTIGG